MASAPRRKPTPEEKVYRALFSWKGGHNALATRVTIWPDPRDKILAAIRLALAEPKRRGKK
jgi:hypothetical protein